MRPTPAVSPFTSCTDAALSFRTKIESMIPTRCFSSTSSYLGGGGQRGGSHDRRRGEEGRAKNGEWRREKGGRPGGGAKGAKGGEQSTEKGIQGGGSREYGSGNKESKIRYKVQGHEPLCRCTHTDGGRDRQTPFFSSSAPHPYSPTHPPLVLTHPSPPRSAAASFRVARMLSAHCVLRDAVCPSANTFCALRSTISWNPTA